MLAQPGKGELRNGADALLRGAFTAVAGARGPVIFMAVIAAVGVGLVIRDLRKSRDRIKPIVFGGMLLESAALAAAFGLVIGLTTAKLLGSLHALSISPIENTSWTTRDVFVPWRPVT